MDPHAKILYEAQLDPKVCLHPLRDVAMLSISDDIACLSLTKALETNSMGPVDFDPEMLEIGAVRFCSFANLI